MTNSMKSLYVIRPKKDKSGDEEKTLYYGVPVCRGIISEEMLAQRASLQTSLTQADMISALVELADLIKSYLSEGNIVSIKGIGNFSVSASSKGFESSKGCTPSNVKAQRICFRASKILRDILPKMEYAKKED